jgi:hypothetical protein
MNVSLMSVRVFAVNFWRLTILCRDAIAARRWTLSELQTDVEGASLMSRASCFFSYVVRTSPAFIVNVGL